MICQATKESTAVAIIVFLQGSCVDNDDIRGRRRNASLKEIAFEYVQNSCKRGVLLGYSEVLKICSIKSEVSQFLLELVDNQNVGGASEIEENEVCSLLISF